MTAVVPVIVALFAAVTAPLLLAWRMDRQHRADRDADWARQDAAAASAQRQLSKIHVAVNSTLTAARAGRLKAERGQLATMRRLITNPSEGERALMAELEASIAELEVDPEL